MYYKAKPTNQIKYLDLASELKNSGMWDGEIKCSWSLWNGPQEPGKKTERTRDQEKT